MPSQQPTENGLNPIVIVGAGHSGVAVAAGLRTRGWDGDILLLEAEKETPYERPPLSKELLKAGAPDESTVLRKEKFYQDKRIDLWAGLTVDAIDPAGRTVQLSDGSRHAYHRLVIATGSRARSLTVPGAGLPGVQALRTRDDALELKRALVPGARVAIIGAGYIGLEVAAAAAAKGCDVTVLEFQDRVMSRVTSEPVSRFFEQLHEQNGVRFVFGAAVTAIEGAERAERVVTADGTTYPADVVLAGIGVVPNQELAADAGIQCLDGILVDEDGRTSVPGIYATGDVTRFTSTIDGASQRLECIQNAHGAGRQGGSGHHRPGPRGPGNPLVLDRPARCPAADGRGPAPRRRGDRARHPGGRKVLCGLSPGRAPRRRRHHRRPHRLPPGQETDCTEGTD